MAEPRTCPPEHILAAFVAGALEEAARAEVAGHLGTCSPCQTAVDGLVGATVPLDGAAAEAGDLAPGTRIGRYVIRGRLGSGGMGVVYEAHDPDLHRAVALKLLKTHAFGAAAGQLAERLVREARAMAQLAHPNVVAVHDVGVLRGEPFVAMELVRGQTLRKWLAAETRSVRDVLDAFIQAGRGLAAAHDAGLVHRDFKPDNVLVRDDGRVQVTDFGLARALRASVDAAPRGDDGADVPVAAPALRAANVEDGTAVEREAPQARVFPAERGSGGTLVGMEPPSTLGPVPEILAPRVDRNAPTRSLVAETERVPRQGTVAMSVAVPSQARRVAAVSGPALASALGSLTGTGTVMGTPEYMAPEQLAREADARSDIFSFCVSLYEALNGERPFEGDTRGEVFANARAGRVRARWKNADVSARVRRALLLGIRAAPEERPKTMHALLAELAKREPSRARRVGLAVAAVLAAGAAIGVGVHLGARPSPQARVMERRPAVAVLDFRARSGGAAGEEWVGAWAARTVVAELAAGNGAHVFSPDDAGRAGIGAEAATIDPKTLARVRADLGARYVVTGTYEALGPEGADTLRIEAQLIDADTGESFASAATSGPLDDVRDSIAQPGRRLARAARPRPGFRPRAQRRTRGAPHEARGDGPLRARARAPRLFRRPRRARVAREGHRGGA